MQTPKHLIVFIEASSIPFFGGNLSKAGLWLQRQRWSRRCSRRCLVGSTYIIIRLPQSIKSKVYSLHNSKAISNQISMKLGLPIRTTPVASNLGLCCQEMYLGATLWLCACFPLHMCTTRKAIAEPFNSNRILMNFGLPVRTPPAAYNLRFS